MSWGSSVFIMRLGLALWAAAGLTLATALGFEHLGGYAPCPLCLQQRYAYYAALALLPFGIFSVWRGWPLIARTVFLAVGLAFLANAGLGVYQSGAEWKFWPGPETCGTEQPLATTASDLMKGLSETRIIRCDEASWRFAGLSFAGWNAVVSFILAGVLIWATLHREYGREVSG